MVVVSCSLICHFMYDALGVVLCCGSFIVCCVADCGVYQCVCVCVCMCVCVYVCF